MKILGVIIGGKTVDDVLNVFSKTINDLESIASQQADKAREHRENAIKETEKADHAAGESGRARVVMGKLKDLISDEKNEGPTPISWPPAAG